MLENGIIKPSVNDYVRPVLAVTNADGGVCFVTDIHAENKQYIVLESATLPRIGWSVERIGSSESKLFSTLDLAQKYWQIPA